MDGIKIMLFWIFTMHQTFLISKSYVFENWKRDNIDFHKKIILVSSLVPSDLFIILKLTQNVFTAFYK